MDLKEIIHRSSLKEHEELDKVKPFVTKNKEKRCLVIQKKRLHSESESLQKWGNLPLNKAKVDHNVQTLNIIPTLIKKIESKMDESYSWEMLAEILFHNEEHWKEMVEHNIFDILVLSKDAQILQNQIWCLSLLPSSCLQKHIKTVVFFLETVLKDSPKNENQTIVSYMIRCIHKVNAIQEPVDILFQILRLEIDHEVLKECLDAILMVGLPLLHSGHKSFENIASFVEDEPNLVLPILTQMITSDTITFVLDDTELLDYLFCAYRFFPLICLEFSCRILEHCSTQEQLNFFILETEFLTALDKAGRSKNEEVLKVVKTLLEYLEKIGF